MYTRHNVNFAVPPCGTSFHRAFVSRSFPANLCSSSVHVCSPLFTIKIISPENSPSRPLFALFATLRLKLLFFVRHFNLSSQNPPPFQTFRRGASKTFGHFNCSVLFRFVPPKNCSLPFPLPAALFSFHFERPFLRFSPEIPPIPLNREKIHRRFSPPFSFDPVNRVNPVEHQKPPDFPRFPLIILKIFHPYRLPCAFVSSRLR